MPFQIKYGNIFDYKADALVVPADVNVPYDYVEGEDYCIEAQVYNYAGIDDLIKERIKIGDIEPGEAKITPALGLSDKYHYLIHTPTPASNTYNDYQVLEQCYYNSLLVATNNKCKSIVFPFLATGQFEFPKDDAFSIAETIIKTFLQQNIDIIDVTLVMRTEDLYSVFSKAQWDLQGSKEKLEKELGKESEASIRENADRDEVSAYRAYLLHKREQYKKATSIEDLLKEVHKEDRFSFRELIDIQRKKLRYTLEDIANTIDKDDRTFRRTVNHETQPKTPDVLYKTAIYLRFDLYQMNRTLEEYGFPMLEVGKLNEEQAVYYYCLTHDIYDLDYIEKYLHPEPAKEDW